MRKLVLVIVVATGVATAPAAAQSYSFACGLRPLLPLGCHSAQCVCDGSGHCQWVFNCN